MSIPVDGADLHRRGHSSYKPWRLCPLWQSTGVASSPSSSPSTHRRVVVRSRDHNPMTGGGSCTVEAVTRAVLPAKRRLRLDPSNHLYFPYEPGTQVKSAIRIKNVSKSHMAFKFQTTSPKSCYMRPSGGILAPRESIIATVFKFVEQPENNEKLLNLKSKVKFKIVSLKVKEGTEYVPELFDEQQDHVIVERVLRVVFLDVERQTSVMEKLKRHLAEAEAADEARKKPPASADDGPKVVGEGLVIDEWKERREKYLARQQIEAVDSI